MIERVVAYFAQHPVLGKYADDVCFALTGSYAVGLGGKGADVDVKVLCPPDLYALIQRELVAAGRIREGDEPEEEFSEVVGDYTLESLSAVWEKVKGVGDMTPLFVYGNLVYLAGNRKLLDPLVRHCRHIPPAVLKRETEHERTAMGQSLYAFLRSFQTEDPVARMLALAGMVRSGMRLAFLAEGSAPPYDKHLFRLLSRARHGAKVAVLVEQLLDKSSDETPYSSVSATDDWHAMYRAAADTPACRFRDEVLQLTS